METAKGYAVGVVTTVKLWFRRMYFLASKDVPRKLPQTKQEFKDLKELFHQVYGLSEDPNAWYTVCSQITSTEATKLRKSYAKLVNAAKRLEINKLAQEEKQECVKVETEKLKTKMELVVSEEAQGGSEEVKSEPKW